MSLLASGSGKAPSRLVVTILDTIVIKGVTAPSEEKKLKTTDKIVEFITAQNRPVSLKEIQEALELKPNLVAGFLVSLCKSNRLSREKLERVNGNGPKMQWFYKLVANPQQNG